MISAQTITVKLTPNAKQNLIVGWEEGQSDDNNILKIQVTAQPEKGKANRALIALLSKQWKIPKSAITIKHGINNRIKILEIEGIDKKHLL